jgi:hypothetical protein
MIRFEVTRSMTRAATLAAREAVRTRRSVTVYGHTRGLPTFVIGPSTAAKQAMEMGCIPVLSLQFHSRYPLHDERPAGHGMACTCGDEE